MESYEEMRQARECPANGKLSIINYLGALTILSLVIA
jgi:hypothetical protein